MKEEHPITLIIFGATGDLAKRKILPALIDLYCRDFLPDNFRVVGYSRKDLTDENYREFALNALDKKARQYSKESINNFLNNLYYKQGDITDLENYNDLSNYLKNIDREDNDCSNKLFYLAVPPNLYEIVFKNLAKSGLGSPCVQHNDARWTRILVEKPFGSDKDNAKNLDKLLGKLFFENQIFRIDHYLAKETIQNILTFRFANAIFEPLWNSDYIEKVEINLYEKDDVSMRASLYDGIGALRDVGQNHILQMLSLIAMEDPMSTKAEDIHKAKVELLSKVEVSKKDISEFIRGQYQGYKKHSGVVSNSKTETYFRMKFGIKNSRWKGVPFYLESGKALNDSRTEIKIIFKDKQSFVCPFDDICSYNNTLTINIQPEQKIDILFWVKKPGLNFGLEQKMLSFSYNSKDGAGLDKVGDAYEKVLFDCIRGDQSLFNSTKEVATQWGIISDVLKLWRNLPLINYEKGIEPKEILKKIKK